MAQHYESDITQFLRQYKTEHPDTAARQRAGRARLWDKTLDPELLDAFKAARVPQQPYVYYQTSQG